MHTLLFADSTQTFLVSQDKIGISVFNFSPFHIYSLDLWFPNGLILEKNTRKCISMLPTTTFWVAGNYKPF